MIQSIVQSYDYKKKIGKGGGGSGSNVPDPTLADVGKVLKVVQTGASTAGASWQPDFTLPSGEAGQVLTRYGTGVNEVYFTNVREVPNTSPEYDYGKVLKTDGTSYFWGEIPTPQPTSTKKFHKRKARVLKSTVEQQNGYLEWAFDKLYIDEDSEWKDIATYTDEVIVALPDGIKNVYSPTVYDSSDNVITGNFAVNAPFEIKCGLNAEELSTGDVNATTVSYIQGQAIGDGETIVNGNWSTTITIGSTAGSMNGLFPDNLAGPFKYVLNQSTQKFEIVYSQSTDPKTIALKDILFEDAVDTNYYEIDVITVDYV